MIGREVVVRWGSPRVEARVPVLVDEQAKHHLPLAPGVSGPGEEALLQYYQGRVRWESLFPEPEAARGVDPGSVAIESTVDTSRILAYQMREFVEALPGMAQDLLSVPREDRALRRALLGSVSPLALAGHIRDAWRKGQRSQTAGLFQLLEVRLALARVEADMDMDAQDIARAFGEASKEIEALIREVKSMGDIGSSVKSFEKRVRAEIQRLAKERKR
jgi:hypothetical protein